MGEANQGTDKSDFNGFALGIGGIMPYGGNGTVGLGFDISVELAKKINLSAFGGFGIEGELVDENGRQKWQYKRFVVEELAIAASFPGVDDLRGLLQWYGDDENPDPNWGQGFRGLLSAKFKGFDFSLQAAAQFGRKDDYKYFFVDALADLGKTGVGTGAINLKGFGGGVSYHMDVVQNNIDLSSGGGNALPPIGQSFSGTQYTPNGNIGLGLKATALIATAKEEIFNGMVSFQILFNGNSGIDKMVLQGSGQFLSEIDLGIDTDFVSNASSKPSSVSAALSAYIDLEFNFAEKSFHGELNAFLDAGSYLQGAGEGGKLVDAELHFDESQWYIYIGRPDGNRAGILFNVAGVSINAGAYLDVGTVVPPMPPLPEEVREIAYLVNDNASLRQSGAGFVMGAAIDFNVSASLAGILSAELTAIGGFDVMLRKYEGVSCAGSSEPVGINGWYAAGQIYAYINGKLKAFGVDIIEAGIAAVLQARLPNPFFAQATLGIKVKILSATVRKSLKIKLGDDCTLVSNDPNGDVGLEVISQLEPFDDADNVELYTQPKAYFALSLNKKYSIPDLNGNTQEFKASLKEVILLDQNGFQLPHYIKYSEDYSSITVVPSIILPDSDSLTFTVTVRVYKNGNFLADEVKSASFKTTTTKLDYIPEANVEYSYPTDGMMNYYPNENNGQGFIKLLSGQPELFYDIPDGHVQKLRVTASSGTVSYLDFNYDNNKITFSLGDALASGSVHKFEIVQLADESGGSSPSDSAPSTNDNQEDTPGANGDGVIYTMYFRASKFNTFFEKVQAIANLSGSYTKNMMDPSVEPFDELEANHLISFSINLNHPWMNSQVKPKIDQIESAFCSNVPGDYDFYKDLEKSIAIRGKLNADPVDATSFNSGVFNYSGNQVMVFALGGKGSVISQRFAEAKAILQDCFAAELPELEMECQAFPGGDECQTIEDYNTAMGIQVPRLNTATTPFKVRVNYSLPTPGNSISSSKEVEF